MAPAAMPVFDGHNDTLLHLYLHERGHGRSFFERSAQGHLDVPRAHEGGLGGGFFAAFVPAGPSLEPDPADLIVTADGYEVRLEQPLDRERAVRVTTALLASLFRLEASSGGQLKVVRTPGELAACLRNGTLAAILHLEGAEAIDPELHTLEVYYRAGLRSLGIVWSRPNLFGHGVPFMFPRHGRRDRPTGAAGRISGARLRRRGAAQAHARELAARAAPHLAGVKNGQKIGAPEKTDTLLSPTLS